MERETDVKVLKKIRYRLVWNHARRLNKRGEGLVQVECQQGRRRIYFSTHVYLQPGQWHYDGVRGTLNDQALNYALYEMRQRIERIELEFIRRGTAVTLSRLREAYVANLSPAASLKDFGTEVVAQSDRNPHTKQNYVTLLNDIERFRPRTLLTDVDYQYVTAYDEYLRQNVGHNTRVSRHRMLRALMAEAVRRDLADRNPYARFRIQQSVAKKGYLPADKLRQMERLALTGKEDLVRDAFLLSCYTGLRYSDITTLRQEHLTADGWIVKKMQKTGFTVEVPYTRLFDGKAEGIMQKYGGDIARLTTRTPDNATTNALLKQLLRRIGASQHLTFHSARHTFATLLTQQGVEITAIQHLLGHQKITTTQIYSEQDRQSIVSNLLRKDNKKYHHQTKNQQNNGKTKRHGDSDAPGVSQH